MINSKYILSIVCFFYSINNLVAQENDFLWAKGTFGAGDENGRSLIVDDSGFVYVTGKFESTVDFDMGPDNFSLTAVYGSDVFILKLNTNGELIWVKQLICTGQSAGLTIALDNNLNVIVGGLFHSNIDLDPGPDTSNFIASGATWASDAFIVKLDINGNYLWGSQIGANNNDRYCSIDVDDSGNIYATGTFVYTADFDPGSDSYNLTSIGEEDFFIQKLDINGNFIWAKQIGGIDFERANSIIVDDNNIFLTGEFRDTVDFDPGIGIFEMSTISFMDVFILKLDTAGTFIWAKQFGGTNADGGNSLDVDSQGNIYLTGWFRNSTFDADPGTGTFYLPNLGADDIFVEKLDQNGNFLWAQAMGSVNYDYGNSITLHNGYLYVTGAFTDTVDFNTGVDSFYLFCDDEYKSDIFILKLDTTGIFTWAKSMGSSDFDVGYSIDVDINGNIYSTGYFRGNTDFDPGTDTFNLINYPFSEDIYVQKLSWCDNVTSDEMSATICDSFSINNNTYYENGIYYQYLQNSSGCDSVLAVSLSFGNNSSVTSLTECNQYNFNGTILTTSGTYIDTIPNIAGCDSVITLSLTINNADTSVSQNGSILSSGTNFAIYQWLDCNNNFATISGETNQGFTATQNGSYAVEVTENGCTDTSACYNITGIGLTEYLSGNNIIIYPNPTKGKISIDFGKEYENANIEITDVTGKIVYSFSFVKAGFAEINLNQETGLYFLKISSTENEMTFKLIKEQ